MALSEEEQRKIQANTMRMGVLIMMPIIQEMLSNPEMTPAVTLGALLMTAQNLSYVTPRAFQEEVLGLWKVALENVTQHFNDAYAEGLDK